MGTESLQNRIAEGIGLWRGAHSGRGKNDRRGTRVWAAANQDANRRSCEGSDERLVLCARSHAHTTVSRPVIRPMKRASPSTARAAQDTFCPCLHTTIVPRPPVTARHGLYKGHLYLFGQRKPPAQGEAGSYGDRDSNIDIDFGSGCPRPSTPPPTHPSQGHVRQPEQRVSHGPRLV